MSELVETIKTYSMLSTVPLALVAAIIYTSLQVGSQSFAQVAEDEEGNGIIIALRKLMYFCGALALAFYVLWAVADSIPYLLRIVL